MRSAQLGRGLVVKRRAPLPPWEPVPWDEPHAKCSSGSSQGFSLPSWPAWANWLPTGEDTVYRRPLRRGAVGSGGDGAADVTGCLSRAVLELSLSLALLIGLLLVG